MKIGNLILLIVLYFSYFQCCHQLSKIKKLLSKNYKFMAAILNFEYGCDKHIRANENIDFVIPQTITFPKMYSFPYLQTYLSSMTVKLTIEVELDFYHKSYDTIFGYYLPLLYKFSLFHYLSILERSIAVRWTCFS